MATPHWVMCTVCGDIIYAGPGINPIPRECKCMATRVIPLEDRGVVQWSPELYEAAAREAAQKAKDKILRQAMKDAVKTKMDELGPLFDLADDEVQEAIQLSIERVTWAAQQDYDKVYADAPKEPEIEYTEDQLDPMAGRVAVPETTINDVYKAHMDDLNKGKLL